MNIRSVRYLSVRKNLPVLVRASLNVPTAEGKVRNTFRLAHTLPTIRFLTEKGARVILIGHLGEKGTETLVPVFEALKKEIPHLSFCPVSVGSIAREAVRKLLPGEVLMLENLRRYHGEKSNDEGFAADLAELADVFVQDSFDVCHRVHASVVSVPKLLPSYAGFQVEDEVNQLAHAFSPKHPALAIIGGAKFATKEMVLKRLLALYDCVFVGGALANDFMAAKGYPMEASLMSTEDTAGVRDILKHRRLMLPVDEVIAPMGSTIEKGRVEMLDGKPPYEAVLDDGPKTVEALSRYIRGAGTVLWNGPLGNYEKGFTTATEAIARAIAASHAHSIVGGGDTVAAIEKLGLNHCFSFISTGGGAMLDFIADGTLPGLTALHESARTLRK